MSSDDKIQLRFRDCRRVPLPAHMAGEETRRRRKQTLNEMSSDDKIQLQFRDCRRVPLPAHTAEEETLRGRKTGIAQNEQR